MTSQHTITNKEGNMSIEQSVWQAAEFITEWDANGLRYKMYNVPREAIDVDDDSMGAILIHGLDDGNVRRVDELLDPCYGRIDHDQMTFIRDLLADTNTPDEVKAALENDIIPWIG
jgi:hypothetical protein